MGSGLSAVGIACSAGSGNISSRSPPLAVQASVQMAPNTKSKKSSSAPDKKAMGLATPSGRSGSPEASGKPSPGSQVEGRPLLRPTTARTAPIWTLATCEVIEPSEWPITPTRPVSMAPSKAPHRGARSPPPPAPPAPGSSRASHSAAGALRASR